jgi:hypothetical protein
MNRLATSSSPYLRQHADNPVDWWPWCPEAFAEAKRRDVPVLVSIGYATCHWCHVMAHECFEHPATAAAMNQRLVCIKVDREEHPEVDAIYMDTVQALTGHGGWPLNAFTDHEGQPFHALTYLPRVPWTQLVSQLAQVWQGDRPRIAKAASEITAWLQREDAKVAGALDPDIRSRLDEALDQHFDAEHPGWAWNEARQPKFPPSQLLGLLVDDGDPRWLSRAESVLEAMQDSGLHDRVGGGFHRYSVDRFWRVPHFEKMLYDNAQLMGVYARAGARLGRADFLTTAINAADYLLRDLALGDAFATAEDADDPSGEGGFYAWSPDQLATLLGAHEGAALAAAWDLHPGHAEIGPSGHAEPVASHIPHPRGAGTPDAATRAKWETLLPRLRASRDARPRPGRDDKLLTDQNALALEGLSWVARLAGHERHRAACARLAGFLTTRATADGLLRLPGRAAYITDYGHLLSALPAAFDLLGDPRLIDLAERVADEVIIRLRAPDGGFFATPAGRSDLVRRGREDLDNAWPCGQSALAVGLLRLHAVTGRERWREVAAGILAAAGGSASRAPTSSATLIGAARLLHHGPRTAVAAGPDPAPLLAHLRAHPMTDLALVPICERDWPTLEGRRDLPTSQVLICTGTTCLAPALTTADIHQRIAALK